MQISESHEGGVLVLSLDGRLDHDGATIFDEAASRHIAAGEKSIIVDFGGVEFLASMGIRALIRPYQQVAPQGGKLVVVNLNGGVREVFRIAGIDKAIPIHDSVAAALAAEFPA